MDVSWFNMSRNWVSFKADVMLGRFMAMYGCSKELLSLLDRFRGNGLGRLSVLHADEGSDPDEIPVWEGEDCGNSVEMMESLISTVRLSIMDLCMSLGRLSDRDL